VNDLEECILSYLFNLIIMKDVEKIDWKIYNVSFCSDPMIEYEIFVLVTLLDKRISFWETQ